MAPFVYRNGKLVTNVSAVDWDIIEIWYANRYRPS